MSFGHFDILQDEAVRQGLKELSNWPTYPQLYVQGELLGGCDIVLQMQVVSVQLKRFGANPGTPCVSQTHVVYNMWHAGGRRAVYHHPGHAEGGRSCCVSRQTLCVPEAHMPRSLKTLSLRWL